MISEENIQSFEYETTLISDGNIIGTCELGKASIQLLNNSNEYSTLKDKWIKTVHGSFYIYDVKPVQEKINIKLSCYDIKYKLDTEYDSSLYVFPMTLKEWRNQIFQNCNVKYDDSDFPNSDLLLNNEPYIGNKPSNRNVIQLIAQAGCSAVITDNNDVFYFAWFTNTEWVVNDWISLTSEKTPTNPVNVVVLGRGDVEDNVRYPKEIPEIPIEFRIDNNYILDPQDTTTNNDIRPITIIPIYNRLKDFNYLIYKMETSDISNKLNIKLGDKIKFIDIWDNELTSYIMKKKIIYLGGDLSNSDNYSIELSAENIKETSTEFKYSKNIIDIANDASIKVDKQNLQIEEVVRKTNEISENIMEFIISGETDKGSLALNKISESEPLYINIKPINENISYLYPHDNLFPSNDLFLKNRKIRFENTTTKEIFDYELPDDLLIFNEETYDEFLLDYESKQCQVIKKVGYNADGTTHALSEPKINNYNYPSINLSAGDYNIYLLGYDEAYLFVKLMASNTYTNTFATKTELRSSIKLTEESITSEVSRVESKLNTEVSNLSSTITQTAEGINQEVSKKVGNDEIISSINQSSEKILINADKISLEGKEINLTSDNTTIESDNFKVTKEGLITALGGTVGGWHIGEHSLWCEIIPPYDYTAEDRTRIQQIIKGEITPTAKDYEIYDLDNDQKIGIYELNIVNKLIIYNLKKSKPGKLILDTSDWFRPIKIVNSDNELINSLSVYTESQES